jgi:alkaline phosphatase
MNIFFNFIQYYFIFIAFALFSNANGSTDWSSDKNPEKWNQMAKDTINDVLNREINKNIAKNVILFLGDGMGTLNINF